MIQDSNGKLSGYSSFDEFFALDSLQNTNDSYMVDLHFSVDMGTDAIIILTIEPDYDPFNSSLSNYYFLNIGATGNDYIKLYNESVQVAILSMPGILSSIQIQSFWLHVTYGMVLQKHF